MLRDSHGVPQVNGITGSKVLRILKKNGRSTEYHAIKIVCYILLPEIQHICITGLAPDIPEDLYYMIKKAVVMRKHLEVNRKDKDGKFRLILVESRIHRLARYYKVGLLSQIIAHPPSACAAAMCRHSSNCVNTYVNVLQRVKKLAPNWKYESSTASALVA